MSKRLVSDELWEVVGPLLPEEPPKPKGGRPRKRPKKLHADKAYDDKKCGEALRRRGIKIRLARKGIESSEKLGRHR
jgi:transposase